MVGRPGKTLPVVKIRTPCGWLLFPVCIERVAEPFGLGKPTRYEVGALAAAAGGGTFTLGRLLGVDTAPARSADVRG